MVMSSALIMSPCEGILAWARTSDILNWISCPCLSPISSRRLILVTNAVLWLNSLENFANNFLLVLWNADLTKLARINMAQEIVGPNFSCLAFEQCLDDLQSGWIRYDYILSLVFFELDSIDVVSEGEHEIRVFHWLSFDLLLVEVVVEKARQVDQALCVLCL